MGSITTEIRNNSEIHFRETGGAQRTGHIQIIGKNEKEMEAIAAKISQCKRITDIYVGNYLSGVDVKDVKKCLVKYNEQIDSKLKLIEKITAGSKKQVSKENFLNLVSKLAKKEFNYNLDGKAFGQFYGYVSQYENWSDLVKTLGTVNRSQLEAIKNILKNGLDFFSKIFVAINVNHGALSIIMQENPETKNPSLEHFKEVNKIVVKFHQITSSIPPPEPKSPPKAFLLGIGVPKNCIVKNEEAAYRKREEKNCPYLIIWPKLGGEGLYNLLDVKQNEVHVYSPAQLEENWRSGAFSHYLPQPEKPSSPPTPKAPLTVLAPRPTAKPEDASPPKLDL